MTAVNNVIHTLRTVGRSKPVLKHVEKLGVDWFFQKLNVAQRNEYTFGMVGNDNKPIQAKIKQAKIDLVRRSIVDEDGILQITPDNIIDVHQSDSDVLDELFEICQKLNGMVADDPRDEYWDRFKAGKMTVDELASILKDSPITNEAPGNA